MSNLLKNFITIIPVNILERLWDPILSLLFSEKSFIQKSLYVFVVETINERQQFITFERTQKMIQLLSDSIVNLKPSSKKNRLKYYNSLQ